jgi:polyphosphate kinase
VDKVQHMAAQTKRKPSTPSPAEEKQAPLDTSDLTSADFFLNRELTWLRFNERVLHEAQDKRTPLLERVKFLAIAASNLDEFFMKRIGGLKQQIGAGVQDLTIDGRTPQQQIMECHAMVRGVQAQKHEVFLDIMKKLRENKINICSYEGLAEKDKASLRRYYIKNIFPLVTPLAMDPAHPFPFISNLSLNLLVTLHYPNEHTSIMARIKVPMGVEVPRFLRIGDENRFVTLEDAIANNLDLLFPDMEVDSCEAFRVTRNANTELDEEEAGDLLSMIETELRDRKFAPIVRLQIMKGMSPVHRGMLAAELGLDEQEDVFESDVMVGMRDLFEIASLDIPALNHPPHHPINNIALQDDRSIFHIIRNEGSILLQHPYESFTTSVERFVQEASLDPKVMAIKMTLYRTSSDTRIISHLIDAARNGKQVAVIIELKARFDEAANIQWASHMEEVGIHVTYGVIGLKTHSKVILVVRRDYSGLKRYAHIGTGNYHAGTARLYSDFGLLTCDDDIGRDLTEMFNYLTTGCKPSRKYRKLLTAPKNLKKALLSKIDREIANHSRRSPGLIRFKSNALEDPDITKALYRASQAGVKVELIIRDTCRLRPGIPGLSENISVVAVIGRFLEHSRIYYFYNGGDEEYFIGSADLMHRNLESRVELIVPVEAPDLRQELCNMLNAQSKDRRSVWDMQSDGAYIQRQQGRGKTAMGCQQVLIKNAEKRDFAANRLRKRKLRSIAQRASK